MDYWDLILADLYGAHINILVVLPNPWTLSPHTHKHKCTTKINNKKIQYMESWVICLWKMWSLSPFSSSKHNATLWSNMSEAEEKDEIIYKAENPTDSGPWSLNLIKIRSQRKEQMTVISNLSPTRCQWRLNHPKKLCQNWMMQREKRCNMTDWMCINWITFADVYALS